jgi:ubiquinone/menaquinone biosynthesis C-methylase UbiE
VPEIRSPGKQRTTVSSTLGAIMERDRNRVCPVELASSLDSRIRRWFQNPQNIVAPYVQEGMTVLDLGCGPGFFSVEMAKLVGASGKVISADLQEGMLQELGNKVRGTILEERIKRVKCDQDKINVSDTVDFILTFYMVHEVPDKNSLFRQLKSILKQQGQVLLVEPKLFHVSRKEFELTTKVAENNGFRIHQGPKLRFSWSAVLSNT